MPRTYANPKTFNQYNKFHTEIFELDYGVDYTVLYPIKETDEQFRSCSVWAYNVFNFSRNKPFELSVNLPILNDSKTLSFLENNNWGDYHTENPNDIDSDYLEMVEKLSILYPNHNFKYMYELFNKIVLPYRIGIFGKYENGEKIPFTEKQIERQKHINYDINFKNKDLDLDNTAIQLYHEYSNESDKDIKSEKYLKYFKYCSDFAYEKYNMIDILEVIGKNTIVLPMVFSSNTAEWSKKLNGEYIDYAFAGEVYFIVTKDTIYYDIQRHF